MKESVEITETLSASASEVYNAWLDSEKHSDMTGGEANCSDEVGGTFTAWDEYISGTNTSLVQNKEIIQSWRTVEFEESDEDSELIIRLKDIDGGCELTLIHNNIPEGQSQYKEGWLENYLEPMKIYFDN